MAACATFGKFSDRAIEDIYQTIRKRTNTEPDPRRQLRGNVMTEFSGNEILIADDDTEGGLIVRSDFRPDMQVFF